MSLATLKKKTGAKYNNNSVGKGFALNGTHRNQGYVGQTSLSRSIISTPMVGNAAKGHGGCCGKYPNKIIKASTNQCLEDSSIIKESTLSTKGMIREKYRWAWRGGVNAPAKSADSNNFNYSSYRTEKAKTDTLSSFDEPGCEILPGVVYPAPRSVFTNATVFRFPEIANPEYGTSLHSRRIYAYDFRRLDTDKTKAFRNVINNSTPVFVDGGTPSEVTEEGVELLPLFPNQNDDNINANVRSISFPDRQTLIFRFKVTTFDSESPTGDARSLFHIVGDFPDNPALQNLEFFSIMYVRRKGSDQYTFNDGSGDIVVNGPHYNKEPGTMVIRYGKTSADIPDGNRFNGYYFHSVDRIELNQFYTMFIDFELLNTTGADPQRDAGRIKLLKMYKSTDTTLNGFNDPQNSFNFPDAMNIEINSANHEGMKYQDESNTVGGLGSGVYSSISPVFRQVMDPGKIMLGSQLDLNGTPVGGDGTFHDDQNLIEGSGFAVVSHLQLFSGEFTASDITTWASEYQVQLPTIITQVAKLIQQNILVRRVGTDQMWTQNREDYNHIDQSQHIERIKSKCTKEDTVQKTRNSKGTPFVGFR